MLRLARSTTTRVAIARTTGSPSDEPSVEPQTSSLVKEQPTRLATPGLFTTGSLDELSRRTRARQPSLTAADLSKFDVRNPRPYSHDCESETPTGFKQPAFWFPSPAPPVTFLSKGGTKRCGGWKKACLGSNWLFLWRLSVSFSPRIDLAQIDLPSSRDGGVYGRLSARQASAQEIFVSREPPRCGH